MSRDFGRSRGALEQRVVACPAALQKTLSIGPESETGRESIFESQEGYARPAQVTADLSVCPLSRTRPDGHNEYAAFEGTSLPPLAESLVRAPRETDALRESARESFFARDAARAQASLEEGLFLVQVNLSLLISKERERERDLTGFSRKEHPEWAKFATPSLLAASHHVCDFSLVFQSVS